MVRVFSGISAAALAFVLAGAEARAEIRVVASIAPVHSLVAQVMQGAGAPHLLIPAGASPHHYSMRPSEAQALTRAQLVFWVGPAFEGWMARPVRALAGDGRTVALSEAKGLTRRAVRDAGVWEAHGDEDENHGRGAESHAHEAHGHEAHGHETHGHETHGHEGAAHEEEFSVDQHFWLDPRNAAVWITAIAQALEDADPANADLFRTNAAKALQDIAALEDEVAAMLEPVRRKPYIVFHDGYQYLEARFGLNAVGSISLPDAAPPGPARLAEIHKKIQDSGAACVFTEPQFPPKLTRMATRGSNARIGALDPIGANIEPGPALYGALIRGLATGLRDCLSARTTAEGR